MVRLSSLLYYYIPPKSQPKTQAVALAAAVTGAAVRTVWHWVDIGRCPVYASRLLRYGPNAHPSSGDVGSRNDKKATFLVAFFVPCAADHSAGLAGKLSE